MRPVRWSKKTDELVRYVAQRTRPSVQSELGHWLENAPWFRAFVVANQDKVRKKLTASDDEDHRLDVRAELLVAYRVLRDRRFQVVFEAYGTGQRGPDLQVTFRVNHRLNVEVTRLRATGAVSATRLADVIVGKLRQLPADLPNGLVIVGNGLELGDDALIEVARLLKAHNDASDDAFFARRGFPRARDFHAQWLRLSAVFVLSEPDGLLYVANAEARHPLANDVIGALTTSLGSRS